MQVEVSYWIFFNIGIVGLLLLDLWVFHRQAHTISMKESLLTSLGWIALALLFNYWIYYRFGSEAALTFLTGYLLEKSLSLDNLFVFLFIFSHFRIPQHLKHQVLFYGVLGAIGMRAILIWAGITLVHVFHWTFYIFGVFLIGTGIKLAFTKQQEAQYENTFIYRFISSYLPLTTSYQGDSFLIQENGCWKGTPLLLVLILIETTDLLFALDSVPAILAITTDPFLVYTSNILAILGLRSLFFALENIMQRFYLFHYALSFILTFIGFKMLLADVFPIPTLMTLLIMLVVVSVALLVSLLT